MANFFGAAMGNIAQAAITKNAPLYVQYYVTARCNLTCEQCNVIYANADQEEATTEQAFAIADNLAEIGTSIVLLTGGEPFVRKDLVDIAKYFKSKGIHPRIQTNGLAKETALEELAQNGIHDISISLDSLVPDVQDVVNGGFNNSWERALNTISKVNKYLPKDSFAAFGCVLAPRNLAHIESVIEFATAIGWWVSLVPAHVTKNQEPRSFSTFDDNLVFQPDQFDRVKEVLQRVRQMKRDGFNVYDSDEYISNIYQFIIGNPLDWRRKNGGTCDAPNLYFAIQPNGDMSVCCDYRLPYSLSVADPNFPTLYSSDVLRHDVQKIARGCSGCMYGSFPEITISARYYRAFFERMKTFMGSDIGRNSGSGLSDIGTAELIELARKIAKKHGLL